MPIEDSDQVVSDDLPFPSGIAVGTAEKLSRDSFDVIVHIVECSVWLLLL